MKIIYNNQKYDNKKLPPHVSPARGTPARDSTRVGLNT